MSAFSVVLVTVPDIKTAQNLSLNLVERKLAACVNMISNISSVYRWKDKIEQSQECLLLIKTKSTLVPDLGEFVKQNHPYSTPEIISLPIQDGLESYLDWLGANTLFTKMVSPTPLKETS